ncbi:hypothetical protein YYG_01607 [Plasmodium vinckei petteri]|uniref:Plasmodium RESA N-terminal domain-containing protein n=1 Tax=Plasmodium vinckei petteri TaxID=138298 RepID=W7B6I6_PLAVN|nr:hypothetical protein YYG_01607 [Plasmodium vinckei petteri]CAD2109101.1 Plasmodium exported protein (PHIST), unknown function [Plasmodium vinckei petteri]
MNTYANYSKIPKLFYLSLLFLAMKYETGLYHANDLLKAQLNVLNSRNLSENSVINDNISNIPKHLRTSSRFDENGNSMPINDIMMAMFFFDGNGNSSDSIQNRDIPNDSGISDKNDLDNKDNQNNQITNLFGNDINNNLYSHANRTAFDNPSTSYSSNPELSNENAPSTSSFNVNNGQGIKSNSQEVIHNEGAKRKCLEAYKKNDNRQKKHAEKKKHVEEKKQVEEKNHVEKRKHANKKKNDKSSDNLELGESFECHYTEEEIASKIADCNKAKVALENWESNTIERLHNNPSLSNMLNAINTIKEIEENHFKVMMLEEQNNCILLGKINRIPNKFIKEKWNFAYNRMRQEISDQLPKIFDDLRNYTIKSNSNVKNLISDIKMTKNKCMRLRGIMHKHNQHFFMESIKKFLKDNQNYNDFTF